MIGIGLIQAQSSLSIVQSMAYYVSAIGTGNGDVSTPASIASLTAAMPTLPTGTTVYFNRGETYEIGDLGVSVSNVNFSAYGSGATPNITGSTSISGNTWASIGGNIYTTTLATAPKFIYVAGIESKWAQSAWITITAKPSTTIIRGSSATLNAFSNLVGAKVRINEDPWILSHEYTVTAYDSATGNLTLDRTITGSLGNGPRFILLDQLQFLTENNSWYYNSTTSTLYYKSSVAPGTLDIRSCTKDTGFILSASNTTISNLKFSHYFRGAIASESGLSSGVTINNCTISDNRNYGLLIVGCNNYTITNSTIIRCANGIARTGDNWLIQNNTFYDMGMALNFPFPITGSYQSGGNAILFWGANNTIDKNIIHDTAYCGTLTTGINNIISKNIIYNFVKRFNDGSAIYTAGVGTVSTTNSGGVISNNIIYDGDVQASNNIGIYIDNRTTSYTMNKNVIYNVPTYGILSNWDTKLSTMTDNIVMNCGNVQVKFREDTTQSPLYPNNNGNVMTGNILAAKNTSQLCVEIESYNGNASLNPFSSGGSSNNNRYIIPYSANLGRTRSSNNGTATNYNLAAWKTRISADAASTTLENLYAFSSDSNSSLELLLSVNNTGSSSTVPIGSSYTNVLGNVITQQIIEQYYAALSVSSIARSTIVFQDLFTGAAGNITGHTPDIGSIWTVESGTISIDGSGRCVATVAGEMYQNLSSSNSTIELIGRVTSTVSGINILHRYTDVNNYIQAQLFIAAVSTDSKVILYNRTGGISTSILQANITALPNTDYTIKSEITGNNIKIYVNNTLYINYTDTSNVNIGINNAAGTKHGLRVPTTVTYDSLTIYN